MQQMSSLKFMMELTEDKLVISPITLSCSRSYNVIQIYDFPSFFLQWFVFIAGFVVA